jgi:hypothetical protein
MVSSLPLFLLLLLSAASFGDGVRLGNGGYEDWRLGTATYVKESQSHPLNDGMCLSACVCSSLPRSRSTISTNIGDAQSSVRVGFLSLLFYPGRPFCIFGG